MQDGHGFLPPTVNEFTFPAKLWRMVNNPESNAVRWSESGDVIFIDRQIFESQILARQNKPSENLDTFRAKHFTSFIRQLNLYGFSRASPVRREEGIRHQFFHPNFRRGHPELLEHLKRLTVKNKNKWKAGLRAPSKVRGPPRRLHEFGNVFPQVDDLFADILIFQDENRFDSTPNQDPESHGEVRVTQMTDSENNGVTTVTYVDPEKGACQHLSRAPGSTAPAAQQTTQYYSSFNFFPSTNPEFFNAAHWSNYSFGDQRFIHPNDVNNYLQLNTPMTTYHQEQNTTISSGYYENTPFPANEQLPVNMEDTSVCNGFPSDLIFGTFDHPTQLPDLKLLDTIEVTIEADLVSEVANTQEITSH